MEKNSLFVLQTSLLIWVVLRSLHIIPSLQVHINEPFYQILIGLLIACISWMDPLIGILCTIVLLVNLKSLNFETLFVCIDEEDIQNIVQTIDEKPTTETTVKIVQQVNEEHKHPPAKKAQPETPPTAKKAKPETPPIAKKEHECEDVFLITNDMLEKAQTNTYDAKYRTMFFNGTGDKGVNIQGVYEFISGYDKVV